MHFVFVGQPTFDTLPLMQKREYHFWVYILASRSRNLYVGMTNTLVGRVAKHREEIPGTHTARYRIHRLVYFEYFRYVRNAIAREKELKLFTRAQKIELIEKVNPTWEELMPLEVSAALGKQILFEDDKTRKASATAETKAEADAEADPLRG